MLTHKRIEVLLADPGISSDFIAIRLVETIPK